MSDFSKLKTKKNGKEYVLNACTQDTEQNITGTKNFSKLTVNSKNVVTSINGITASESGNVQLGTEKSTFNKVVYDTGYFSIGTAKSYSFDLTGSDLENVSKENVNIRIVAKVVTAGDGYNVGDIAQLTTAIDTPSSSYNVDVCAFIRGNTLYIRSASDPRLSINNGTNYLQKANVQIKAVLTAFVPDDGSILLIAEDQTNTSKLIGLPDGTLTWKNKNIIRSVNNVTADENGNVEITIPEVDLSGLVKSVNSITPDSNGNVTLDVLTTPGNIIKWETDFFDIAPSGLYSFDLTNTPFANIPREAINIQMVGKVKTAQNGYKIGDYVYPQFGNYVGTVSKTKEAGSTPYISGNVLSIRFGDDDSFVVPGPNGATSWLVKANVKVKLILTALIEEV